MRPRAREMARGRIAALDAKIAELERARRSLAKLARECAAGAAGPCPIIASFEEAQPAQLMPSIRRQRAWVTRIGFMPMPLASA
jgi:hypothetical protein